MRIFQTDTSRKKRYYHILRAYDKKLNVYHSLCGSGSYWVGGYQHNKPAVHPPIVEYDGQPLCPACVMQAYIRGKVDIVEKG
jgi:hypothetical protein